MPMLDHIADATICLMIMRLGHQRYRHRPAG
jgi:hypothetical protein